MVGGGVGGRKKVELETRARARARRRCLGRSFASGVGDPSMTHLTGFFAGVLLFRAFESRPIFRLMPRNDLRAPVGEAGGVADPKMDEAITGGVADAVAAGPVRCCSARAVKLSQ